MTRSSGDNPRDWPVGTDEKSFERLFFRYRRPVRSFFAKRGFSADRCDDLTQETFLRVYRGLPNFRHESHFETWLFQIAHNVFRNEIRDRGAVKRTAIESSLDTILAAEDEAADGRTEGRVGPIEEPGGLKDMLAREQTELLSRALAELPPQMRQCVMLRLHGGLRYQDIADLLGIALGTVRSQLFEARARLREKLAGRYPDIEIR